MASRKPSVSRLREPVFKATLEDPQFATTLARGLEILRCFSPQDPELGNKDFVRQTGLPKATVSRFTYTLSRLGYLRQTPGETKYRLGAAVLSLGYPLLATLYVRQAARLLMNELALELGGSIALGIRDRLNMVYIETSRASLSTAPPFTEIGYAHPIPATSMGRAYLAACEQEARAAILNEMRVTTPHDWRRYRSSIESALSDFPRKGFCVSVDFFRAGVYGVAAPMRQAINGEIMVFNCAVYADTVPRGDLDRRIGPSLVRLCRAVENMLHP
jgi:DNA-binding IclR family transcriptional regulator